MKDKIRNALGNRLIVSDKTTKVFFLYTATGNRADLENYEIIYDVWTFTKYSTTNQSLERG
jgi:hypothetical protein